MRTTTDSKGSAMTARALRTLALGLAGLCALAGSAQAAPAPTPAWKLLAITAPTHLPPRQSEVQRVMVEEATGGTFTLARETATGSGTPAVITGGKLTYVKESTSATIASEGVNFEVGLRLIGSGLKPGTEIVSCSPDCVHAGSTLTLAEQTTQAKSAQAVTIITKELTSVTGGPFLLGDELTGTNLASGTVVAGVGSGSLTLSKAPGSTLPISFTASERTAPLAYNATAGSVQAALNALPAFDAGTFTVTGGPGDEHPFLVTYGGDVANEDVAQLSADPSGLTGQHAFVQVFTSVPGGPGTGEIVILPANIGGLDTSGTATVTLGPLPPGVVTTGAAEGVGWNCPGGAGASTVTCTTGQVFPSLRSSELPVNVPIEVGAGAPPLASVPVKISGGGVPSAGEYDLPLVVSNEPAPFGIAAVWAGSFEADGSPSTQAGAHPHTGAAYFMVNTARNASGGIAPAGGDARDEVVDLPPGFVGNPLATKRCPQSVIVEPKGGGSDVCNDEMSVGILIPFIGSLRESLAFHSAALFNDRPPRGYAAEFSTRLEFPLQSVLATVNSEGDYGVRLYAFNNANYNKIFGAFTAFEGVPQLGNGQALLTNPVNCAESAQRPPVVSLKADTYQEIGKYSEPTIITQPTLEGCDQLEFKAYDPSTEEGQVALSFQPSSTQGSTPVGATAHLHIDQSGLTDPDALTTPHLKRAVVKLPAGLSLNPSQANGLEACSEEQIGYRGKGFQMPNPIRFTNAQPSCPDGSKLGSVEIETPLLDNPLVGEVYLAAQEENPFGSLIAIYLVVNDPLTGVIVKLPGEVQIDANTGQLTAVFDNNPQLPFEDMTLRFRGGGPRSEFATPEVCGTYTTRGSWEPWSAPESGPPAQTSDSFTVSENCASSTGARRFSPSFEAGTTSPLAGGFSPLVVKVKRADGEQELSRLDFTMPPGFTAKLAGVPYCSEGEIASAQSKRGREEQAHSSCPTASRLGSVSASAGVGSEPFTVPGNLYLSGPYKGAPLSAVAITPAVAGPFDLGNVVIRAPLYVDPESAQVTAKSDPIPTVLEGIPLKVREVAVNLDRPDFALNPTSCEAMRVTASLGSSDGATATPENRFQVGGCEKLSFAPKTYFRLFGGTGRGAHPKVRATYIAGKSGEANLLEGAFTIPRSEFLDQAHIRTICTRVQFAADNCPKGAVYGHVKAFSPIVDYPVSGPVYLRSSNHKLPDLVFDLHGPDYQPVHVVVALRVDSIKGQIRVTAENAPDVPVSKLIFIQQGGKKGLLVNSRNICAKRYRATIKTEAHNGKTSSFRPVLKNSKCSKQRRHKRRGHRRGRG